MPRKPIYAKQPLTLAAKTLTMSQLVQSALQLNQLQNCLNQYLQPAAKQHCHISSFQQGTLHLLVNQSHWATRLRYQQKRLIQQLLNHKEFMGLEKIIIKVSPDLKLTTTQTTHYLELSESAAQTIKQTAQYIKHTNLKAALERLASHSKAH